MHYISSTVIFDCVRLKDIMGWTSSPESAAATLMKLYVMFTLISNCAEPVDAITQNEFYPFGSESGDTRMRAGYWNTPSSPISGLTTFPFFGQNQDTLYVSLVFNIAIKLRRVHVYNIIINFIQVSIVCMHGLECMIITSSNWL